MTREVFDRHASATGDRPACKKDTAYRDTRRDNPLPGHAGGVLPGPPDLRSRCSLTREPIVTRFPPFAPSGSLAGRSCCCPCGAAPRRAEKWLGDGGAEEVPDGIGDG